MSALCLAASLAAAATAGAGVDVVEAPADPPQQATQHTMLDSVWRLDAPVELAASGASSGIESSLALWAGVRTGRWFHLDMTEPGGPAWGLSLGTDFAGYLGNFGSDGTPEVHSDRAFARADVRALLGVGPFTTTFSAFLPYVFGTAILGGGAVRNVAFDDAHTRLVGTVGVRAGLGLELVVWIALARAELAAGLQDGKLQLATDFSLGVAF